MSTTRLPQDLLRTKRDGAELSGSDLRNIADGIADGTLSECQVGAFAMAVYLRGMTPRECAGFTLAMRDTGDVLDWRGLDGPVLDKHSTGGVGDLVSLALGPAIAACGGYVPMISGRGLGHTGGTLDKLEAIPGYNVYPPLGLLRHCVREAGVAIVGASERLAPADRRLYAVRDVTATVASIPLITASILAKKLAAGLDALVLDVKAGNGAMFAGPDTARQLAQSLVRVANEAGLRCVARLTAMDQPLADAAGNALEVLAALRLLRNEPGQMRLREVTLTLGAELLVLGGLAANEAEARRRLEDALASGAAAERFARMVRELGGPGDLLDAPERHLALAPLRAAVPAGQRGLVEAIDTRALGRLVVALGGGRTRPDAAIDHRVGLDQLVELGQPVEPDTPLAVVHAADASGFALARATLHTAIRIGEGPATPLPACLERIGVDAAGALA